MVRIGSSETVVIDPFNGGTIVGQDRLIALLERAEGVGLVGDSGSMNNHNVLVRLLLSQATRAEQVADPGRAMTLYQRMTLVVPANPDGW